MHKFRFQALENSAYDGMALRAFQVEVVKLKERRVRDRSKLDEGYIR